jgi:hypothetical protein
MPFRFLTVKYVPRIHEDSLKDTTVRRWLLRNDPEGEVCSSDRWQGKREYGHSLSVVGGTGSCS